MSNLKSSALVEITIGDRKILGLGTSVDWAMSNEASGIAMGVGGFNSSRTRHAKLYSYILSFNTFDTSYFENGNFNLQELNIEGTSQVRISRDNPNLNSTPETIFTGGGADIFTGVSAGEQSQSVSVGSPIMRNFTLLGMDLTSVSPNNI